MLKRKLTIIEGKNVLINDSYKKRKRIELSSFDYWAKSGYSLTKKKKKKKKRIFQFLISIWL